MAGWPAGNHYAFYEFVHELLYYFKGNFPFESLIKLTQIICIHKNDSWKKNTQIRIFSSPFRSYTFFLRCPLAYSNYFELGLCSSIQLISHFLHTEKKKSNLFNIFCIKTTQICRYVQWNKYPACADIQPQPRQVLHDHHILDAMFK